MVCGLWALIYDAVEIKFTVIISLLKWPSSLSTRKRILQGKHYTLIDVPVHGDQTEPNPVSVACFSCEL